MRLDPDRLLGLNPNLNPFFTDCPAGRGSRRKPRQHREQGQAIERALRGTVFTMTRRDQVVLGFRFDQGGGIQTSSDGHHVDRPDDEIGQKLLLKERQKDRPENGCRYGKAP